MYLEPTEVQSKLLFCLLFTRLHELFIWEKLLHKKLYKCSLNGIKREKKTRDSKLQLDFIFVLEKYVSWTVMRFHQNSIMNYEVLSLTSGVYVY